MAERVVVIGRISFNLVSSGKLSLMLVLHRNVNSTSARVQAARPLRSARIPVYSSRDIISQCRDEKKVGPKDAYANMACLSAFAPILSTIDFHQDFLCVASHLKNGGEGRHEEKFEKAAAAGWSRR